MITQPDNPSPTLNSVLTYEEWVQQIQSVWKKILSYNGSRGSYWKPN